MRDEFHMHVDVFRVPSKSPQLAVNSKVSRFILDSNDDDGLMVIYYGGHGFRKAGRSTKLMMTAYASPGTAIIFYITNEKQR